MNWADLPFGLYAVAGSVLIAAFALIGHWITQKNENVRHARKLAYEAAITEWQTYNELFAKRPDTMPADLDMDGLLLEDFILSHLAFVDELRDIDVAKASAEDLAPVIKRGRARDRSIIKLRQELDRVSKEDHGG